MTLFVAPFFQYNNWEAFVLLPVWVCAFSCTVINLSILWLDI